MSTWCDYTVLLQLVLATVVNCNLNRSLRSILNSVETEIHSTEELNEKAII